MVSIAAGLGLLAAIYFLLPPAPVRPGADGTGEKAGDAPEGAGDFPWSEPDEDEPALDAPGEDLPPEQIAAFRKMHADLPGNIFLPVLPDAEDRDRIARRDAELRRMRALHFKIEKGQATPAERERYYDFRIQYNRDKIAMLEYVAVKKEEGTGTARLPEHIQQMIAELNAENESFARKR